jgi:hypothetical protein
MCAAAAVLLRRQRLLCLPTSAAAQIERGSCRLGGKEGDWCVEEDRLIDGRSRSIGWSRRSIVGSTTDGVARDRL